MDIGTLVFAVQLLIVDTYLCTYRYSLIAKIKVIILCLRERFIILIGQSQGGGMIVWTPKLGSLILYIRFRFFTT